MEKVREALKHGEELLNRFDSLIYFILRNFVIRNKSNCQKQYETNQFINLDPSIFYEIFCSLYQSIFKLQHKLKIYQKLIYDSDLNCQY